MSSSSPSFRHFLLLYVGAIVMLAGVLGFFAMHDQDWKYSFDEQRDWAPRHAGSVAAYEALPEKDQTIVDGAIGGKVYTFETREPVPPAVVKYDDTYFIFKQFTVFDWAKPGTFGPVLTGVVGFGMMVEAARRDLGT